MAEKIFSPPLIRIQKQTNDSYKLPSAQLQAYFETLSGVTNSFVASDWEAAVHYVSTNTLKIRNMGQNTGIIIAWAHHIKTSEILNYNQHWVRKVDY